MVKLEDFLRGVEARKAALGMSDTPEQIDALRNKGLSRTPEKRQLLRQAAKRGEKAGKPSAISHY